MERKCCTLCIKQYKNTFVKVVRNSDACRLNTYLSYSPAYMAMDTYMSKAPAPLAIDCTCCMDRVFSLMAKYLDHAFHKQYSWFMSRLTY